MSDVDADGDVVRGAAVAGGVNNFDRLLLNLPVGTYVVSAGVTVIDALGGAGQLGLAFAPAGTAHDDNAGVVQATPSLGLLNPGAVPATLPTVLGFGSRRQSTAAANALVLYRAAGASTLAAGDSITIDFTLGNNLNSLP